MKGKEGSSPLSPTLLGDHGRRKSARRERQWTVSATLALNTRDRGTRPDPAWATSSGLDGHGIHASSSTATARRTPEPPESRTQRDVADRQPEPSVRDMATQPPSTSGEPPPAFPTPSLAGPVLHRPPPSPP